MKASTLLITLTELGATLKVSDGQLYGRRAQGGPLNSAMQAAIRPHKEALVIFLTASAAPWPDACRAAECAFGDRSARLYPLLDRAVITPDGPGTLVQVFATRAAIALDREPDRLLFLPPEFVAPVASGIAVREAS